MAQFYADTQLRVKPADLEKVAQAFASLSASLIWYVLNANYLAAGLTFGL